MKLKELLKAVDIISSPCQYPIDTEIESLCHDSRKTSEASVFVCMSGATVDGHDFAPSAYSRGCRFFIAERDLELPEDAFVFKVFSTFNF